MVRLSVSSSSTLTVTFQEPQGLHSTVVTRYRGERPTYGSMNLRRGR